MILESMKMEIPVVLPDGGRLIKLLVEEGMAVKEGQELAVIESA
jgi:biotin carboxyl carrier protein